MAGGLVALLDDVAALVKATAASLDDVAAAAGRASVKSMGVVVDDAAVTPRYVQGLSPQRELPIIWKIALGSIRNKLLIILPVIILLTLFAPKWVLPVILMAGGTYLAFEGAEKVMEAWHWIKHHETADGELKDEKSIISGAVRTDLILSAEIMVIAQSSVSHEPVWEQALVLIVVAFLITILVYGAVGLIVKMDDIGLALAKRDSSLAKRFGSGLVKAMPIVMTVLANVGIVAMMWVGGHILLVQADELGFHAPYGAVHHLEEWVHHATGPLGGFLGWLTNTVLSAIAGFIIGAILTVIVLAVQALLRRGKGDAVHEAPHASAGADPEGSEQERHDDAAADSADGTAEAAPTQGEERA
ncbi:DUF808 domain-containing protein [Galactobacter valiniphilus]|uniref:DUF808 domain-containing protein n=1 Tax=Galactobacter valiniphilus TaxID=2676122 RepID=A0A399JF36_9MICC|nr:DUF808 domain-containing protein [Galactobacter valiniphilus]RII43187.1 DUF808 domain-containing protein [Galactobacter valiniphilus]